jgi:hypothetical protein
MNAAASSISGFEEADETLVSRIDTWLVTYSQIREYRDSASPQSALDLEVALYSQDWSELTPCAEEKFDRLRKKIEVARKIFRYYLPDLSRAAAPIPLSCEAVQRLCCLLLKLALIRRDARYLNSALKLLDGILDLNDCSFPEELNTLAHATLESLVPLANRIQ